MADAINVNASKIDAKILAILSENSGKKLFSITTGMTIQSLLYIHPAPQSIIRAIVSQRCIEDLILLFCMKGAALAMVHNEFPKIDMNYWVKKSMLVDITMWKESPEYKVYSNMLQEYNKDFKKNYESTRRLVSDYFTEHIKEGFNLEQYITSHRELLSYHIDTYLIMMIVAPDGGKNMGANKNNEETFMWMMREELALAREKYNYTP